MAKKNKKVQVRTEKDTLRDDIQFLKDSLLFLLLCATVMFTLRISDFSRVFARMTASWLPYAYGHVQLKFVFAVLTLCAFGCFVYSKLKKIDATLKYFSATDFLGLSAFCLLYCFTFGIDGSLMKLLVFTAVCGALYYINRFYNRDFVWFYLFNVFLCYNLWAFFGAGVYGRVILEIFLKAVGVIAILSILWFAYRSMKKSGKVPFIKWPFAVSAAFFVILGILCAIPGIISPLQAMVVILVQFIAAGVYYTVKILN